MSLSSLSTTWLPIDPDGGLSAAQSVAHTNPFKETLHAGKVASSLTARLVPNYLIAQLAVNAGFHAVMVDMEHTTIGREKAAEVFAASMSAG